MIFVELEACKQYKPLTTLVYIFKFATRFKTFQLPLLESTWDSITFQQACVFGIGSKQLDPSSLKLKLEVIVTMVTCTNNQSIFPLKFWQIVLSPKLSETYSQYNI